jgi:hypothetical protein
VKKGCGASRLCGIRLTADNFGRLLPFARALIAQDWPFIQLIAAALLQYRQLDYAEVLQLIRWMAPWQCKSKMSSSIAARRGSCSASIARANAEKVLSGLWATRRALSWDAYKLRVIKTVPYLREAILEKARPRIGRARWPRKISFDTFIQHVILKRAPSAYLKMLVELRANGHTVYVSVSRKKK